MKGRRRTAAERFRDAAHARRVQHQDESACFDADEPFDCRDGEGFDRLLAALVRRHGRPPEDVRPPVLDGMRFDWRGLVARESCGVSPAFACMEA
jgi:hypothetical protein